MPSPFPGMDPYLEGQKWRNFHNSLCIAIRNQLVAKLAPRFLVDVEERLVVEIEDDEPSTYVPDVSVTRGAPALPEERHGEAVATLEPQTMTYRRIEPAREVILQILDGGSRRVVTVIEVFSPWNKTGTGFAEYLGKREDLLQGGIDLLEIDLLRRGRRLPTVERLPTADSHAFVIKAESSRTMSVYSWTLRDPLPDLPVPLPAADVEASISLRQAFSQVYDEASYCHLLNYATPPEPPFPIELRDWIEERLNAAGLPVLD